jgi:hypothetical protein
MDNIVCRTKVALGRIHETHHHHNILQIHDNKQWRLVRGGRVGSAHPKPNDIFFLNLCILIFKFTNYLIDDLLLESKCFYRYIKTFPRRIFVRVDMSSLRGVR